MTKEELINSISWYENEQADNCLEYIDEFFSQNVCIPKGENRHPYADVLHEWLEGAEVLRRMGYDEWVSLRPPKWWFDHDEYRIKPSEPVYEWQWMYKFKNGNEFKFTGYETEDEVHHFMSTLDKDSIGYYATKIEETKRERKQ